MKLTQFLMGLDDCYQSVRSALLTRDPLPEIKNAYTTVSREESHRRIPEPSNVTESKINATSFAAKSYPPGFKKVVNPIKQSAFKQSFNSNSNAMSNEKQQSSASQSSSSSSFTPEQMRKLLSLINDTPETIHANMSVVLGYCDLKKEITLGTGSESGGLYLFDMEPDNNIGKVNMVISCHVSKDFWNNRLGHPANQVLNMLKSDLNLTKSTSMTACEVCHRAKQIRDPFLLSDHKSKKLGELIYLDLWGPYRITSREGFKYFFTVVDDLSRVVWVYLIKTKDEVFDVFVSFVKMIHNQFDVKIKTIRSDNRTEFINKKMDMFLCHMGIIQQTSWMPTSVINGKSPYELVHGNKPDLSYLRSFGCLCFSTVLNNHDKFTSRDVRFYETVFPFKMRNKSANDVTDVDFTNKVNHLTVFDNQLTQSPNDEGRATLVEEALGWHLEEIHMTWAHLEKKRTRLQLYTKVDDKNAYSSWRRIRNTCDTVMITKRRCQEF
ncbi:ribonuclease H-like domain-containing protein [Tanacetum coccineum]